MKSMKSQMVVALVSLLLWGASFAVAIPYQDKTLPTDPPTTIQDIQTDAPNIESSGNWDLDWSGVYNYKGSSAVAIDSHWLLTAAHVADDGGTGVFTVEGTIYTPQGLPLYYNGTTAGSTTSSTDKNEATADLALVRFDNAFPTVYDYKTTTSFSDRFDDVILVGYGYGGEVMQDDSSGSWNQDGNSDKIKRWGTNNIDQYSTWNVDSTYEHDPAWPTDLPSINTMGMYKATISETDDFYNTDYETGFNTGDSGGPMFVKDGDEWIVAGINILALASSGTTYSVAVGDYDEWVTATVPEPATMSLLALGGIAMLRRRKK